MKRNENILRELWDNIKRTTIHIRGVPEGKEREKRPEKIFEKIIAEYFLKMGKETVTQVQEAPRKDKTKEEHAETHSNQIEEN